MSKVLKMILGIGLFVLFVSFFPINNAHANSQEDDHIKLFEVKTESIMRTAPNEEAESIGNLIEGDHLRTFDEMNGWVKTFYEGQPVWVYSEDLLLLEENRTQDLNHESQEQVDKKEENTSEENQNDNEQVDIEEEKVEEENKTKQDESNQSNQHEEVFFNNQQAEHPLDENVELSVGMYKPKEVQISEDTIVVTKSTLNGYSILIDPGHGGEDAGAVHDDVYEKSLTLSTAEKLATYLENEGATVNFTREGDTFNSLQNRVKQSNTNKTDAFISLHYDYFSDSSVNGINTYYSNSRTSGDLANKVHSSLADNLDMNDRGIRNEGYYVLAHNQHPAVLLELGFMTNPGDFEKIQSEEYQKSVAKAITEGLMEYFDEESVE
ncbi:N-acetylmuramoyl-L-alanine amidase [Paucisalibacillus globulus]|uniref:N-acetylmuramoyl-L-alanine amidase n=1 Tax=Paucisalibacillus globulus TaxID=351095 RepID=UPI00042503F0|nr:N-acetylmuramoyl-L-alanine amidase [Paucisalibacillus globulus]